MHPGSSILPLAVRMSWHCLWQSCSLQNSTGIPAPFETFLWLALRRGPIFGAVGLHAFCLPSLRALHVKTSILVPSARKHEWKMQPAAAQRTLCRRQKRIHHGTKIGTTHLEAGLLILVLWPHFEVQNLAPVLGPQNTNRS